MQHVQFQAVHAKPSALVVQSLALTLAAISVCGRCQIGRVPRYASQNQVAQ
jgi:hypothetical protein